MSSWLLILKISYIPPEAVSVLVSIPGWLSLYILVMNHQLMKLNYCLARHLMSRLRPPLHDTRDTWHEPESNFTRESENKLWINISRDDDSDISAWAESDAPCSGLSR